MNARQWHTVKSIFQKAIEIKKNLEKTRSKLVELYRRMGEPELAARFHESAERIVERR